MPRARLPRPAFRLPRPAFRLPRRTLRMRLALLYGALFCACAIALAAAAEIFAPNFLVRSGSTADPQSPGNAACPAPCAIGTTHQVGIGSAVILVTMVALSLAVGWLIAGRLLRPLRAIISSARDISASNLHKRLSLAGPDDEFRELGATLDDLFGRLEASFESQRHFVANASHELRTPLAAERTLLQVALADPDASADTLRSTCQQLLDLGEQQERLIEALLTLTWSERGLEHREPFDLAEVAGKVIGERRPEAGRRGIGVSAALDAAPATGDPSLTESLVANLVDNALRHNAAGGQVEISTAVTGGRAVVSVSNTGRPIPAEEVDRLFQPFQRLGAERIRHAGGHGLGLAIVRAIAGAHGATIAARARPEGGLTVEVSFPETRPG